MIYGRSDPFHAPWNLNKEFYQFSVGLCSDDEQNRHVQLGKTFIMAQIIGYWCHICRLLPESYRHWFQARSHSADTQLPGVLRAFNNIDDHLPEVRWWWNADKSSADFIRRLQSQFFLTKGHAETDILWCVENLWECNSCTVAQLSLNIELTTDASKSVGEQRTRQAECELWNQDKNNPQMKAASLLALQTLLSRRQIIHILLLLGKWSPIASKTIKGKLILNPVRFDGTDMEVVFGSWRKNACRTHPGSVQHNMADAEYRESFMLSD